MLLSNDKIFIAGHNGLVGSAVLRNLSERKANLLLRDRSALDLLDFVAVKEFLVKEKPDVVILCAAKVGGIYANNIQRADFIYQNLTIQNNIIWNSFTSGVRTLVFLGSSCIYPKYAKQPICESELLSGYLESTNQPYAIAKIAGIELVNSLRRQYNCDYFSVMPTNLYGINDNFDLENAHVLPMLLRRVIDAKRDNKREIVLWGTGKPLREFMLSDACASAIVYLLEHFNPKDLPQVSHINVGSGHEVSIKDLAHLIVKVVGYEGNIVHDITKPDGTPRKLLDCSLLHDLGWRHPSITLEDGVKLAYDWYINNIYK